MSNMRMIDIIAKKRDGAALTQEEIDFFVHSYTCGDLPDYQAAALLMAIYLRGMDRQETVDMTCAMAASGDQVDLSSIPGTKVDKHSTGGVGDKTTLIVAPIVASCGVKVAKMSGRGLGHTGGTVDKLESIPGYRTQLTEEEFLSVVQKTGLSLIGQSGELAPADKKLYALRDATATVESKSLIAASIMSKKLAAGADCILLDVKCGNGAFMKTQEEAMELAKEMVSIGKMAGRRTAALITDMDIPLGNTIGNALEVEEAVETLCGRGPEDLTQVCIALAAHLLMLAGLGEEAYCTDLVYRTLESGKAYEKLLEVVKAQGGDISAIKDLTKLPKAAYRQTVDAETAGYVTSMDAQQCGKASVLLGAGRSSKEDGIDYGAGIRLLKKTGDYCKKGEALAILYTSDKAAFQEAAAVLSKAYIFSDTKPRVRDHILGGVGL